MVGLSGELLAAVRLMRPRQWPVLSVQLGVGIGAAGLLGGGLSSLSSGAAWPLLLAAWLAWVVLLNGGTLAFNSAYDRDIEPVAYLTQPPTPPRWLSGFALIWMALGILVGWLLVSSAFGVVTAVCVGLSLLYSHPRVRCKARPGWDLAVNMAGYGAGTTLAGLLAGTAAFSRTDPSVSAGLPAPAWWLVGGFALLFGSFYPLTQLYQLESDRRRGDRTLATALGVGRSLTAALVLGLAAAFCLLALLVVLVRTSPAVAELAATTTTTFAVAWPLALALAAWLGNIAWWLSRWRRDESVDHERGMYRALALWTLIDVGLLGSLVLALQR